MFFNERVGEFIEPRPFVENGPVVQLNRTSDSGSESRGFESRRGHFF